MPVNKNAKRLVIILALLIVAALASPFFLRNSAPQHVATKPDDAKLEQGKDMADKNVQYQVALQYGALRNFEALDREVFWLKRAAAQGHAGAAAELGALYLLGDVRTPEALRTDNDAEGMRLLTLAAAQNDPAAEATLCTVFEGMPGGPPADADKALQFCKQSAAQNFPAGMMRLSKIYLKPGPYHDPIKAAMLVRDAAALQDPVALNDRRHAIEDCRVLDETIRTPQEAESCLLAALYGDSEAAFVTGNLYSTGKIFNKNLTAARAWWRQAAYLGDARAPRMLAAWLHDDNMNPLDSRAVYVWLNVAEKIQPAEGAGLDDCEKSRLLTKMTPEERSAADEEVKKIVATISARKKANKAAEQAGFSSLKN